MAWGAIGGAAVSLIGGEIFGDDGGGVSSSGAPSSGAAQVADPFASQRKQYQTQLQTLMQDPGSFESSPAYGFAFDQGLEAVNRTAAAKGMLGSGNRLYELTKYGQGLAGQQYMGQANLLATLAGATSGSPGTAGGIQASANQAAGQGAGQLANSVIGGVADWWNDPGAGGSGNSDINMTGFQNTSNPYGMTGSSYGSTFTI